MMTPKQSLRNQFWTKIGGTFMISQSKNHINCTGGLCNRLRAIELIGKRVAPALREELGNR